MSWTAIVIGAVAGACAQNITIEWLGSGVPELVFASLVLCGVAGFVSWALSLPSDP